MTFKNVFYTLFSLFIVGTIAVLICNKTIINNAKGKTYSNSKDIPYSRVGLLLGTGKYVNYRPNPYYVYRIDATINLVKAGKLKYVIVSGDNSRKDYDEPTEMRTDLIKGGVDSSIIYLDYAGFRTFDSIKRLKEVFNQDSVTIISQQFHNERAIYIATRLGITAIGYNATDVNNSAGMKTSIREMLARVKVFLDFLFGKKPKFLGPKVSIP